MLQTKLGWLFVCDNYRPERQVVVTHQVLTGDLRADWLKYITDFVAKFPPEADLYARCVLECDDEMQLHLRRELFADPATAARYPELLAMMEQLEVGDGMIGAYRCGPDLDRIVGFSLHRNHQSPKFSDDEIALARMALEEIREMDRRGHLILREPTALELAPRLHQVLDRVLSGRAPKQIAQELDLSVHTVREHMQRLYQRYDVGSREDLMAKFVK